MARLDGRPVFHTHELGRLVVGCRACIAETRTAEAEARWTEAPRRRVTWTCSYVLPGDDGAGAPRTLKFTLVRRVPDDATPQEVGERYAADTGEAFAMALPDTVPMDATTFACEYMEVTSVTFGLARAAAAVDELVIGDQLDLFEIEAAP